MGKSLIIKGADFSANAIPTSMPILQGYVITNPSSSSFGKIVLEGTGTSIQSFNIFEYAIKIPSGKSAKFTLYHNWEQISTKTFGYLVSSSYVELVNNNFVPNILEYLYPLSTDMVQSDGTYKFTNTSNSTQYWYISYGELGVPQSANEYSAEYVIIDN